MITSLLQLDIATQGLRHDHRRPAPTIFLFLVVQHDVDATVLLLTFQRGAI